MTKDRPSCKSTECFFLAFLMLTTKLCTNMPLIFTGLSGTGAPLSVAISGVTVLILLYFFFRKFYADSSGNIIQNAQKALGKPGKYLTALVLLAYLLVSTAYLSGQFSDFTKNLAFPTAPLWFVAIFFLIGAFFGALGGIKSLLRLTRVVVPLFIVVFVLLIVSVLWMCDFSNIFPLLGNGIIDSLQGGLWGTVLYSDIILIFLINPFSNSPKTTGRGIWWGSVLAVIFNILLVFAFTAKIPYPLSLQEQFPLYLLSKEVYFGRFFQRIDAILLLSSALCNMLTLAFNFGLIVKVFEQIFDVNHHISVLTSSVLTVLFFISEGTVLSQQFFADILAYLSAGVLVIALLTAIFPERS